MTVIVPGLDLERLTSFLYRAKSAAWASDGGKVTAPDCRTGAKDHRYCDGDLVYLDSYFGYFNSAGQEIVHFKGKPVWAMNYFGRFGTGRMVAVNAKTHFII
jgi:hypothetical protein